MCRLPCLIEHIGRAVGLEITMRCTKPSQMSSGLRALQEGFIQQASSQRSAAIPEWLSCCTPSSRLRFGQRLQAVGHLG
jgi:hypothetical protein